MNTYRVCFYNDLPNAYGKYFRCCQFSVEDQLAENEEMAIAAAKKKFEAHDHISHWSQHARSYVVEAVLTSSRVDAAAAHEGNRSCHP